MALTQIKFLAFGRSSAPLTQIKVTRGRTGKLYGMTERPLIDPGHEATLSLVAETRFVPNGIVSRVLFRNASSRVVLFGFAAGQELSEHTSTSHALIQILSGCCEFILDGKPRILHAGELLHMPPHFPHAVKATESFSMLLTLLKPGEPFSISTGIPLKDPVAPGK